MINCTCILYLTIYNKWEYKIGHGQAMSILSRMFLELKKEFFCNEINTRNN
jgi:hypothetical protein